MQNSTLLADFYQLTMMQGYFNAKTYDEVVVTDMFFRKNPCGGGYTIISGINELIDFIQNLKFSNEDLEYIKSLNQFDDKFISYLKDFSFNGDIWAVKEGSVMFPHEPIIRVKANILEATYIEAALLSIINFQSLIATKASRVCKSARGDAVMEFGLRRAQGLEAGLLGSKAAIIGGCAGTSNLMAGKLYDVPVLGTHSHAWIQSFDTELEAFSEYAKSFPKSTVLLVDTYDTLKSGIPNAIKVFNDMKKRGEKPMGIRIDSGDLEYLSKKARVMLDEAGFEDVKIIASDNLDEYKIANLKNNGAKIDSWGVGTKLITSYDYPSLGGVYKLSAIERNGEFIPKMKFSEDPRKMNNPGFKQVYRLYDKKNDKALADIITEDSETIDESKPLEIFHPLYTYRKKSITNFYAVPLLEPLFENGKCIRKKVSVKSSQAYATEQKSKFWNEYLRNIRPETYKVDLSEKLWDVRKALIEANRV